MSEFTKTFRLFTTLGAALCLVAVSACIQPPPPAEIRVNPLQAYIEHHVTLSVTGDANGYTWTLREQPASSAATLNSNSPSVDFTPDVVGDYTVAAKGGNLDAPVMRTFSANPLPDNTERVAREVVNLINEERGAGGTCRNVKGDNIVFEPAAELSEDDHLESAALKHSREMMIYNYFAHESIIDGSRVRDRIEDTPYEAQDSGENLAKFTNSGGNPSKVVKGWLDSPKHCEAIRAPAAFTEIGLAVVDRGGTSYWTAVFAKPKPQ